MVFKTYTGQPLKILGEAQVHVCYQQQVPQDLPLVIVEGSEWTTTLREELALSLSTELAGHQVSVSQGRSAFEFTQPV